MINSVNKISIIGGPGTGKSILAKNLGKSLNLPVYNIDAIHYLENWKTRDKHERDKIILNIISEPKWILDGTYSSTLEKRVSESDMIIFLNYPTFERLKGIFTRYLKNKNIPTPEIPGCRERITFKFLKTTLKWDKNKGKIVNNILEKYYYKQIFVFKNRTELSNWYEKEFGKKIKIMLR